MTTKATVNLLPLQLDINKATACGSNDHKEFVFDKVLFDTNALWVQSNPQPPWEFRKSQKKNKRGR
jgi:hypothetical protein